MKRIICWFKGHIRKKGKYSTGSWAMDSYYEYDYWYCKRCKAKL